jgi:hypothetical protein
VHPARKVETPKPMLRERSRIWMSEEPIGAGIQRDVALLCVYSPLEPLKVSDRDIAAWPPLKCLKGSDLSTLVQEFATYSSAQWILPFPFIRLQRERLEVELHLLMFG